MNSFFQLFNFRSKGILLLILALYLIACYLLPKTNTTYFQLVFSANGATYLSLAFSLISLFWIYDTRQAVNRSGRKNKLLNLVLLIDKIISRDLHLSNNEFIDLFSEIKILNPSGYLSDNVKKDSESDIKNIDLKNLDREICETILFYRSDIEHKTKKISEIETLFLCLNIYKKMIELDIMEASVEKTST